MAMHDFKEQPARPWRIVLGVLLLLTLMGNSMRPQTQGGGVAGAAGTLTGATMLFTGGVYLINSGLPRAPGKAGFAKSRRRLWLGLAWLGFVVVVTLMFTVPGRIAQFLPAGFGIWIWVSWPIAGAMVRRLTRVNLPRPTAAPNL
jgi:hypothetical protein